MTKTRYLHLLLVYPLAFLGGIMVLGLLTAFIDEGDEIPPELICTVGYPCYEQ